MKTERQRRIGAALDSEIVALGAGPTHLRVTGPTTLSGSITVKSSKNAGVALLCAACGCASAGDANSVAHPSDFPLVSGTGASPKPGQTCLMHYTG